MCESALIVPIQFLLGNLYIMKLKLQPYLTIGVRFPGRNCSDGGFLVCNALGAEDFGENLLTLTSGPKREK
jgi:hypothetical protein